MTFDKLHTQEYLCVYALCIGQKLASFTFGKSFTLAKGV